MTLKPEAPLGLLALSKVMISERISLDLLKKYLTSNDRSKNIEYRIGGDGGLLIILLTRNTDDDVLSYLINSGDYDNYIKSAPLLSFTIDNEYISGLLIRKGADLLMKNENGETPMYHYKKFASKKNKYFELTI